MYGYLFLTKHKNSFNTLHVFVFVNSHVKNHSIGMVAIFFHLLHNHFCFVRMEVAFLFGLFVTTRL